MRKKKFLNCGRVLCLSPHPDDIEYSMSATIEKCNGTLFHIQNLSWGGLGDITNSDKRLQESVNFWRSPERIENAIIIENYWGTIQDRPQHELVAELEKDLWKYDALLIPSSLDTHPDHQLVNSIAMQACRHSAITIIEYKSPSCAQEWIPNTHFIMESAQIVKKIARLQGAFESQLDSFYFIDDTIEAFHVNFYNYKREVEYAEMFKILQMYT